ncbi:MAG: ATP-binding protein [Bacteroidales bacterium]|nr:ATP-binding protein [Bacteroidales bacterium]
MKNALQKSLLPLVEAVARSAKRSRGEFSPGIDVKDALDELSTFFGITPLQAWLFSIILELNFQQRVTIDSLASHLRCSTLKVIDLTDDLDALEDKMLVQKVSSGRRRREHNESRFTIPSMVVESLRTGNNSLMNNDLNLDLPGFLERAYDLLDDRNEEGGSSKVFFAQLNRLIENNKELSFVAYVNEHVEQIENKCLVFSIAFYRLKRLRHYNTGILIEGMFDNLGKRLEFECNIASGQNELISKDILHLQESDFKDGINLALCQSTIKALFSDYPELSGVQDDEEEGLIQAQRIKEKPLFFESRLQLEVDRLTGLLQPEAFEQFRQRLKEAGLPSGLAAIFTGLPGTGKTESAYQMARKTGRDIIMVDLSQVRSKWHGESEKQVKAIFTDYREKCSTSKVMPILLINEADGLFSKRTNISERSSAVDRTGNTMQNILLQEMEDFEGILFATTNLSTNLDTAFERRFLFKIEFGQPTPEARQMIWKAKMPILEPEHLQALSGYQLSGGEIENVARRYMAEKVIDDTPLSIERIMELCESEKPFRKQQQMGFRL